MTRSIVMVDIMEHHRRLAAKRKAMRHAVKAALPRPVCRQCGEVITLARRLASPATWSRVFCGNACRQAAWRDRHGE
jgi:RNA polymerase-binding transcription factor DksA